MKALLDTNILIDYPTQLSGLAPKSTMPCW